MSLYLTAVDEQVKSTEDSDTIGLILCTSKDSITAEYTLRSVHKPVGVATYETTSELPEPFKDQLPTVKELEEQLESVQDERV
jgi:YhcG PDDEXK nuclease domain